MKLGIGGAMARRPGVFDFDERMERPIAFGVRVETDAAVVDFDIFRPDLEAALGHSDGARGGRPRFDPVMMIPGVRAQHGLGDDRTEFLIGDRLSFMRFLDLHGRVPDARTIRSFREGFAKAGATEGLFRRFDRTLVAIPVRGDDRNASGRRPHLGQMQASRRMAVKGRRCPT